MEHRSDPTHCGWSEIPMHWTRVAGPSAVDVLNGLVTNDVRALANGGGQYAAALTPKGKVLADLVILRVDATELLVGTTPAAHAGWRAMLGKYVNPRLATCADASEAYVTLVVTGRPPTGDAPSAGGTLGDATRAAGDAGGATWPGAAWQHAEMALRGCQVRVVRVPWYGSVPAWLVLARADEAPAVRAALASMGTAVPPEALDAARIEAGWPRWGVDMDDATIPQEANLDVLGAISFSKGCYTGQETVARVHFRGHVNRHLRGLRSATPLVAGAVVCDGEGKEVGTVTSSRSREDGSGVALAMIRREVAPGDPVRASGGEPLRVLAVLAPPASEGTP